MALRGVTFRLNCRLNDCRPGNVVLSDGEIRARTLVVWTAGTAPNPLLKTLPVETDRRGALVVENTMGCRRTFRRWAVGDCAALKDGKTGNPCPPTAQFALREARTLARNIRASIQGRPLQPFHFDSLGALCVVGHQTACAELTVPFARQKSMRFRGLLAWLLWRGNLSWKIARPGTQSSRAHGLGDRTVFPPRYCSNHRVEIVYVRRNFLSRSANRGVWLTGLLGGLALMAGTHASIVVGPVAGLGFWCAVRSSLLQPFHGLRIGFALGIAYALLLWLAVVPGAQVISANLSSTFQTERD